MQLVYEPSHRWGWPYRRCPECGFGFFVPLLPGVHRGKIPAERNSPELPACSEQAAPEEYTLHFGPKLLELLQQGREAYGITLAGALEAVAVATTSSA